MEVRRRRIHYTSDYTFARRDASKAGGAEGGSARLGGFAFHQKIRIRIRRRTRVCIRLRIRIRTRIRIYICTRMRTRMRIGLRRSFVMERKSTQPGWPK